MRARPGHGDTCGADMKPVYLEDTGSQKVLHLLQHSRAGSGLQDCVWVVGGTLVQKTWVPDCAPYHGPFQNAGRSLSPTPFLLGPLFSAWWEDGCLQGLPVGTLSFAVISDPAFILWLGPQTPIV